MEDINVIFNNSIVNDCFIICIELFVTGIAKSVNVTLYYLKYKHDETSAILLATSAKRLNLNWPARE